MTQLHAQDLGRIVVVGAVAVAVVVGPVQCVVFDVDTSAPLLAHRPGLWAQISSRTCALPDYHTMHPDPFVEPAPATPADTDKTKMMRCH
jgi:hypothetical protein